jgi:glucose/arabinose dehydrogenase
MQRLMMASTSNFGLLDHDIKEGKRQLMPDGALLVSDDNAGAISRITYGMPG